MVGHILIHFHLFLPFDWHTCFFNSFLILTMFLYLVNIIYGL
jgi:hypothetical protein